jgi:hypothetical protein
MGEMKNGYKIWARKREGRRPLGTPRHRWEHNIRMDLRIVAWECADRMHLAQDRVQLRVVVNTVINFRVP